MKSLMLLAFLVVSAFALEGPNPNRHIIQLKSGVTLKDAQHKLEGMGVEIALTIPEKHIIAGVMSPHLRDQVAGIAFVDFVEQDAPRYPAGTRVPREVIKAHATGLGASLSPQEIPYGIIKVQALEVDASNIGNRKLCIIDSGYDYGHEDLQTTNIGGWFDSKAGNWSSDDCGHGTHVAGTIVALNNKIGVVGVNPSGDLNLYIVRVFSGTNCAWTYSSNLIDALQRCTDAKANVVSMSLGGPLPNTAEGNAFLTAQNSYNMLSIAAAGNDGNTRKSYPASYPGVMSVAAVDQTNTVASFSQANDAVEISAPGVAVLSTYPMGKGVLGEFKSLAIPYKALPFDGSPIKNSGLLELCDCGDATSNCPQCNGMNCLVIRGTNSFSDKVSIAEKSGCKGVGIYNNVNGSFTGTLNGIATAIPSVSLSGEDGQEIKHNIGMSSQIGVNQDNYEYLDGTSMATPHVSGVAALVWSNFPNCPAATIRNALTKSAKPLGPSTPNNNYGYGLVQAQAAVEFLSLNGACA